MNAVRLIRFVISLLFAVSPSLFRLAWSYLPPLAPLTATTLLLIWIALSWKNVWKPTATPLQLVWPVSRAQLIQEKNKWQTWYQQQPTHRDVLLQIAWTERQLGNENGFEFWWKKAQAVDPNYSGFSTLQSSQ